MMLLKTVYEKLVTKVNTIDISGLVLKTEYNTDNSGLGKKNDSDKQIIMLRSLRLKEKHLVLLA